MRQYHDLVSDVLSGGTAGAGTIVRDGVGNALGRPNQSPQQVEDDERNHEPDCGQG